MLVVMLVFLLKEELGNMVYLLIQLLELLSELRGWGGLIQY